MSRLERARARHGDPSTSHAAAASVKDLSKAQDAVLRVLRMISGSHSVTDEELVRAYQARSRQLGHLPRQTDSGLRTRRAELSRRGLIEEGEKRRMQTGRLGRTWRAKT